MIDIKATYRRRHEGSASDHIHGVNHISSTLGHFLALSIPHNRMQPYFLSKSIHTIKQTHAIKHVTKVRLVIAFLQIQGNFSVPVTLLTLCETIVNMTLNKLHA